MGLSPYERAAAMFAGNGYGRAEFEDEVRIYAQRGYVLATPLEFALVRPVCSKWSKDLICNIALDNELTDYELTLNPDCWHIGCVVGGLADLFDWLPYALPLMSMERRGLFLTYTTSRIYEIAKSTNTTEASSTYQRDGNGDCGKTAESTYGRTEEARAEINTVNER